MKNKIKKFLVKGNICNQDNRKNAGITLVALVITIVVLIILATVVINLSLGQNGLFNKAKIASQEYKNAQDYEEEQIAKYSNDINSYVDGNRDISSDIENLQRQIDEIKSNYVKKEENILVWSLIDVISPNTNWVKSTKDINQYKYIAICCGSSSQGMVLNPSIISVKQFKEEFISSSKYFCSQVTDGYIARAYYNDGIYIKSTNFNCSIYGIK